MRALNWRRRLTRFPIRKSALTAAADASAPSFGHSAGGQRGIHSGRGPTVGDARRLAVFPPHRAPAAGAFVHFVSRPRTEDIPIVGVLARLRCPVVFPISCPCLLMKRNVCLNFLLSGSLMSSTALFAVCRPTSDRPSWRKIELQMAGSSRIHLPRAVRENHLGGAGGAGLAASLIASVPRIRRADPRASCRSRHGLRRLTRARRQPRCGGWPLRAVFAARQRSHASLRGGRASARPDRVRAGLAPSRFAATVRAGSTRHRAPSTFF